MNASRDTTTLEFLPGTAHSQPRSCVGGMQSGLHQAARVQFLFDEQRISNNASPRGSLGAPPRLLRQAGTRPLLPIVALPFKLGKMLKVRTGLGPG